MSEVSLKDAMKIAIEEIRNQSPEEYVENVKKHKDGAFSRTLSELESNGLSIDIKNKK